MRDFLATLNFSLPIVVSQALHAKADATAKEMALTWVLRRKTIVLDALCEYRETQLLAGRHAEIANLLERRNGIDQQMRDLTNRADVDPKTLPDRLAGLVRQRDEVEATLHQRLSKERRANTADDEGLVRKVRERLPDDAALIEIIRIAPFNFQAKSLDDVFVDEAHYLAFVIAKGEAAVHLVDLGPAKTIDSQVKSLFEHIEETRERYEKRTLDETASFEAYRPIAQKLHAAIIGRLQPALGNAKRLVIAPDGPLHELPFEALVDEKGKYLLDAYPVVYLGCGRDLLKPQAPLSEGTTVFAGPNFNMPSADRSAKLREKKAASPKNDGVAVAVIALPPTSRGSKWGPLVGAAQEGEAIRKALVGKYAPIEIFSGDDALEETFKTRPAPRLLHMATHGFYFAPPEDDERKSFPQLTWTAGLASRYRRIDDPLWRSGIVLAGANFVDQEQPPVPVEDGWITAAEIALLDFRGTDLVVLSACETGRGDLRTGEGVAGLRRAFHYAGARTVVSTVFKIPDAETKDLVEHFYTSLKDGKNKLDALHDAKTAVVTQRRAKKSPAHPFFWAGFVLVGRPE